MAPNPIIEKIRKLQALAERAGTEAEAANAAARVRELLEKHNLDMGAIQLEAEPGTERHVLVNGIRRGHLNVLARACCSLFDVEMFWTKLPKHRGWHAAFIGLGANVEAACITFDWLLESVEALLDGWKRNKPILEGFLFASKPVRRTDYDAFRNGASVRIHEMAQDQKQMAGVSLELVHIGNAVAKRMLDGMQFGGKYDPTIKPKKDAQSAFRDGYREGARVDLHGARESRMLPGGGK